MLVVIFILLALCFILGWVNHPKIAIGIFLIVIVLAFYWYGHHATDVLQIQL